MRNKTKQPNGEVGTGGDNDVLGGKTHTQAYDTYFFETLSLNTRFSTSLEKEQADAGRDGRTRLERPNY